MPDTLLPSAAAQGSFRPTLRGLYDLFFRPSRFFADLNASNVQDSPTVLILIAWSMGLESMVDQLENQFTRVELGQSRGYWSMWSAWLFASWTHFWLFMLLGAASWALWRWYFGGWWYGVRLKWAGAREFDALTPRLLNGYSSLISALPLTLLLIVETITFPSYPLARDSEELVSYFLLAAGFWAIVVSYKGAMARCALIRWRALLWFLVLPWLVNVVRLGVLVWLYIAASERLAGSI